MKNQGRNIRGMKQQAFLFKKSFFPKRIAVSQKTFNN
jgi:hypothetical protein